MRFFLSIVVILLSARIFGSGRAVVGVSVVYYLNFGNIYERLVIRVWDRTFVFVVFTSEIISRVTESSFNRLEVVVPKYGVLHFLNRSDAADTLPKIDSKLRPPGCCLRV